VAIREAFAFFLNNVIYDCIIVGGGPAGLSDGLMLARYQRPVLTLDEGIPRNMSARCIHGFLGHDGIAPGELLKRGRAEVQRYGGVILQQRVEQIARMGDHMYEVRAQESFQTRAVLLAMGIRDVLPDCEGFMDFYGVTAHHCSDCDGYEVRGKRVAVIPSRERVLETIEALRTWTEDIVLLTNGVELTRWRAAFSSVCCRTCRFTRRQSVG
jgi:thioredoxin reductase